MTTDLKTQLRGFAQELSSDLPTVELDEILAAGDRVELEEAFIEPIQQATPLEVWWRDSEHPGEKEGPGPVRPLRPGRPTLQRHRLAVALVTVVSVLVLLGAVNWLLRSGVEDSPVVTQPPSPTLSSSAWSRVPHDEMVFGGEAEQSMSSVIVGGPGLVAVGTDGSVTAAAVWTSVDGVTWSRVPHDEMVFGGEAEQSMSSVIVGGPGLVAVGTDGSDRAAVWTSVDGITWSRVPHDEAVFGGGRMSSVTVGGPGLVAVGSARPEEDGLLSRQVAAVWTSVDGITWSRVPHDEAVFSGEGEDYFVVREMVFGGEGGASMNSVTAGGPGLVAVGERGLHPRQDAAVWTSVDGITWSRVPHDEAVFGGEGGASMNSVTVGGPGLVAVGWEWPIGPIDAAVWTSVDGITWSRVPHDEAVFGGTNMQSMESVAAGGPGLVAVGWDSFGRTDAVVWTSVDGMTWSRVADLGNAGMVSVTGGGPGLVAVGYNESEIAINKNNAAVWVAATEN